MKKIILFVMVILIFLSGCNENALHNETENPDIKYSNAPLNSDSRLPEILDPVSLLSIYQPAGIKDEKYFNLMGWQEYIKDKLNIEINVFYSSKELTGVQAVYYFNSRIDYPYARVDQVFDYVNPDMAYDLTPYYEKYGWDRYIESDYIEALKIDGSIYAVPTASQKYIIPRYYNAEYLKSLSMDVPTDINSFQNYLIESKKIMEGDGILLPMFIPQRQMFPCMSDIFRAFGAYVNSEQNSTMSFNPNTQSFEDAVFSENIEAALGFIKSLQEQGLMGINGEAHSHEISNTENQFIGDRLQVNKNFATEYNFVYDNEFNSFKKFLSAAPGYESVSGYYLEHINSKNVCEIRSDMGFYVFPKNIQNIHGTIDLFNSIMTDKTNYANLLYGVENVDYVVVNEEIFPILPDIGTFPGIRMLTAVEDSNNYYSPGNIGIISELTQDLLYESNIFNQMTRYRNIVGNSTVTGSFHNHLFMTGVSTSDAVEEYKRWFFGWGMNETIEKLNERIGAVSAYDYTP